jgi:tRNA (guanine-N7-)-methyltransferase
MLPDNDRPVTHRTVRSFVRRAGRLTGGQKRALEELWPVYGIAHSADILNLDEVFGRRAPRIVEIGFGNGDLLAAMAENKPETDFLGIEVHEPGVGHCLMTLGSKDLSNVRVSRHDALEVIENQIADGALDGVNLFFPDPWPKKRHHKRRIVQPAFVALLARKIAPGGLFRTATDWANYAEHIDVTVSADSSFEPVEPENEDRLQTRFEQRGKKLGHEIRERAYRRIGCTQQP